MQDTFPVVRLTYGVRASSALPIRYTVPLKPSAPGEHLICLHFALFLLQMPIHFPCSFPALAKCIAVSGVIKVCILIPIMHSFCFCCIIFVIAAVSIVAAFSVCCMRVSFCNFVKLLRNPFVIRFQLQWVRNQIRPSGKWSLSKRKETKRKYLLSTNCIRASAEK